MDAHWQPHGAVDSREAPWRAPQVATLEVAEIAMSETNTGPMERADRSDPDVDDRCGARTRAGSPCQKYPAKGADRCRFHGGASTGPSDTAYLEGNDHAAGNPGGGAPELNTNAEDSGAYADWRKVYERLAPAAREEVEEIAEAALSRAREHAPDVDDAERQELALEYAVLARLLDRADVAFYKSTQSGAPGAFEKAASALGRSVEISTRRRKIGEELRLWPGVRDEGGDA